MTFLDLSKLEVQRDKTKEERLKKKLKTTFGSLLPTIFRSFLELLNLPIFVSIPNSFH